jgi:hypothetical protein
VILALPKAKASAATDFESVSKDQAILDFSSAAVVKMTVEFIKSRKGLHWFLCTRCRNQRSLKQNNFLWGVVYPIVAAGIRDAWGEEGFDEDSAHDLCKQMFLSRPIVNKKTGEEMGRRIGSTTDLNTITIMEYIDKIREWALKYLGAKVPYPETT